MDEFKRFFVRGLAAVLPTLLTIALFLWAYNLVNTYLGTHITSGMLHVMAMTGPPGPVNETDTLLYGEPINEWLPSAPGTDPQLAGRRETIEHKLFTSNALRSSNAEVRRRADRDLNKALWWIAFRKYNLQLVGFLIAIIVVYFVGLLLTSIIGRTSLRMLETALTRIPLVRAIYPNIKQVTDFLFGDKKLEFSGVVALQYPRIGIWSVGLLTGRPMEAIEKTAGEELVTIFIPSSPTPVTGYTITVPRREIVDLTLSIDEALRFIISAGVIKPDTDLTQGPMLPADGSSDLPGSDART